MKLTVDKFGYRGQNRAVDSLLVSYRPGTSDEKVIKEVLSQRTYQKRSIGFLIDQNDTWLDLGANIGTFSLLVLGLGSKYVYSVEAERDNLSLLRRNLLANFSPSRFMVIPGAVVDDKVKTKWVDFYLCHRDDNKYRHSLLESGCRKKSTGTRVRAYKLTDILDNNPKIDCIKMDIEGSEINLLETTPLTYFRRIRKLVFEYSFDVDPSIPRFLEIINRLRTVYTKVHYTKVKEDQLEYRFYPPYVIVYCC